MNGPAARPHWHDAYDAQMALWRWYRTPGSAAWITDYLRSMARREDTQTLDLLARLWDGETGRLLDCDPLYVSAEMCEVVEAARSSFAPEPLLETDLITPRGFLWYARPISMLDRRGNPLDVHAFSWAREYASHSDEAATEATVRIAEAWDKGERIRPPEMDALVAEGLIYPYGVNITLYAPRDSYVTRSANGTEPPEWVEAATRGMPVVPMHVSPWHFNQTFEGNEIDKEGVPSAMDEWWRTAQTTFRLMQQRISVRHFERPHRQARRHIPASPLRDAEVVVVRLRREQGERHEPTGEPGNYSHRWIVGGHWRNQPYPSEGITRQIWISPYVKGPEDKPLIVRPRRVFQWER